jgi:carboxylesterase
MMWDGRAARRRPEPTGEVTVRPIAGAEPFQADGGPIGVVLSHGFTGTPASMRPWAQYLAAAGYTVRLPLLPGHGTSWQEANRTGWPDWYGAVEAAYRELAQRCRVVFAAGLSMGGTLVTRLAEQHGDGVAGLVLVNPAFTTKRRGAGFARYLSWAVKSRPGIGGDIKKPGTREPGYERMPLPAFVSMQRLWQTTVADLPRLTAPVLLYRSVTDHVVDPSSAALLKARAKATTIREERLYDSYHVATLDNDAPRIFAGSVEFFAALADANRSAAR